MRVGIIGAGNIAHKMADTVSRMEGMEFYAIASRTLAHAEKFVLDYPGAKAYGSYAELLSDEMVDLVYVATVHSTHKDIMLQAIAAHKPVLCEKSFTINEAEAELVLGAAKEAGVFVAEAIWPRYMPFLPQLKALLPSIGRVTSITANLGYQISDKERIIDPAVGGGALLDIGVYPLSFIMMVHPDYIDAITGLCQKGASGVDMIDSVSIRFADGVMASFQADATAITDRRGMIYGTEGVIEVVNVNNPERINLYDNGRTPKLLATIPFDDGIGGFEYEVEACRRAIEAGVIECEEMPHKEILRVMRFMDALRRIWGVKLSDEV